MSDTTYIISGYMRSGTSMLMRCLVAGGMQAAYDEECERPYELCPEKIRQISFPRDYEGCLLKVSWKRVTSLASGKYHVLYVTRGPLDDEIDKVTLEILTLRKDMTVVESSYREILDCPTRFFQQLKYLGWPIKAKRAAAEVDLTMYRNRHCVPCQEAQRDQE